MVASEQKDDGGSDDLCPAFGRTYFMSSISSSNLLQEKDGHLKCNDATSPVKGDVTINTAVPISPRMNELLEGLNAPGDSGNLPNPPPWLDKKLFERGRQFYRKYLVCLCISDLLALIGTLSIGRAVKPLIFTGRSDTPQKAKQRYFSTLIHIITWYTGDVWNPSDPAHKDVLSVRSIHNKIARLLNSSYNHDRVTNIKVSERGFEEPKCPFYPSIRKDIKPQVEGELDHKTSTEPPHYISQIDMCFTQFSFMGLLLTHPKKLGARTATEEDFLGLIHYWRGIGWLLGIEDKYNFCNGTLAETRALCLEVERLIVSPALASSDWNYEHMTTSLISGIGTQIPFLSYPAMFRYLTYVIDIKAPNFIRQMSFLHTFHYWIIRLFFGFILIIPGMLAFMNRLFEGYVESCKEKEAKEKNAQKLKINSEEI